MVGGPMLDPNPYKECPHPAVNLFNLQGTKETRQRRFAQFGVETVIFSPSIHSRCKSFRQKRTLLSIIEQYGVNFLSTSK